MPEGDGTHSMMVSKELQSGAKAVAGEKVHVTTMLHFLGDGRRAEFVSRK